jgi:hypothetical protein
VLGQIWIYISNLAAQIYETSVINVGMQFYNRAPITAKKLEEYEPYKRELKSFLIDHAFYSVEFLCYLSDTITAWTKSVIIIFNAVYVQTVKISTLFPGL